MSLRLKEGVNLRNLSAQIVLAMHVAQEAYESHGYTMRVTSVYRSGDLLHDTGQAVDLGIKDGNGEVYPDDVLDSLVDELHRRLGKRFGGQFDVVDERVAPGGPHIHIEWDPR
jgi:hypothetical protein